MIVAGTRRGIVIGVDLGTTYSAVAWAQTSKPDEIELIRNWPTAGQVVGNQVPTEISYSDDGEIERTVSWGYDIGPRNGKIQWFKLGLDAELDSLMTLPAGYTVSDVTRDFLTELRRHVQQTLVRRLGATFLEKATYHYVLTVPAMWSDAAKKRTETAAIQAGYTAGNATLELLSEPESAAVFSLRTVDNALTHVTPGSRIVVCDAGGGTVDLISYSIIETEPSLKVIEATIGVGDFCGSSFIDRRFKELFAARLGPTYENLSRAHQQQALKNFESCKTAFRGDNSRRSYYVNVPTLSNLPAARVEDGSFEINHTEMKTLFDTVIDQVIALIKQQVAAASTETEGVNAILLVGGFGESEYLYQRVQQWASLAGMTVLQPREASTAVVQGAVMHGAELHREDVNHVDITRRARRSYGVPTKEVFQSGLHNEHNADHDYVTGQKLAIRQIHWFIRANQVVGDHDIFRHRFFRTFTHLTPWVDSLVSSPLSSPPATLGPSVQKHCTIKSDLTKLTDKPNFRRERRGFTRFYVAEYELVLALRNNNLSVWLECDGKRYGVSDVKFETIASEKPKDLSKLKS